MPLIRSMHLWLLCTSLLRKRLQMYIHIHTYTHIHTCMCAHTLTHSSHLAHISSMFRQQQLQFRPSPEEVRAKYYREMKKFICIPLHFRGVGEATSASHTIFPRMISRNAARFSVIYKKVCVGYILIADIKINPEGSTYLKTLQVYRIAFNFRGA